MIVPNTMVQLTADAVQKYIKLFDPKMPIEPDLVARRELLRDIVSYDDMIRHPGVLYLSQMADQPDCGIFATHEGTIKWGYQISDYEPYNYEDHGAGAT